MNVKGQIRGANSALESCQL